MAFLFLRGGEWLSLSLEETAEAFEQTSGHVSYLIAIVLLVQDRNAFIIKTLYVSMSAVLKLWSKAPREFLRPFLVDP